MRKHRSLRQKREILQGTLWAFAGLMVLAAFTRGIPFLVAGAAAGVGFIALLLAWWRCPACGASLARFGDQGDFCTRCGAAIDWDK